MGLVAALLAVGGVGAQGGIEVRESASQSDFPHGIVFTLDAASDVALDEVRLIYEIAPDGVRASAIPDCVGGTVISCTFQLGASRRALLIPGAEVTYFWRLTKGDVSQETASQVVVYEDDRFDWRMVSDGNLTLWWYSGSEEEARAVLAAGRESLDGLSRLLQTSVDFPVKIFYYASAREMEPAIIADNVEGVVTLGEVVYSDTAMVSADAAALEIARHEVAHIVVRQAVPGPFGIPDWLNEGTAVFAQTQPLENQLQALEGAIRSGRVFSVRSLSSASTGALGDRVSLFYGQSWSLVDFLVNTYGEEKFTQLFQAFEEGATTAEALEQVYGFNQDGLENAWRDSVGLPPRQAPTPGGNQEQAPPTEAGPTPEAAESEPGAEDGGGVPLGVILVIVGLTALLAGGLVGAGVFLARRYR
ncbi:MAG: hypothetical protein A2148_10330 [Chloroflexi bacterium RBG_16_68_14]|nr:MAG: hypothetical protein A2148_10330 [Chloroflexi bacterium RBG_16_68_14]